MTTSNTELLTPDEVADRLNLHVKTVRRYIREGQLPSVRIGKRYRVPIGALNAFAEYDRAEFPNSTSNLCSSDVSSVVTLEGIDRDLAMEITKLLTAASQGHENHNQPLFVKTLYSPEGRGLKVIVNGGLRATTVILDLIQALLENGRAK
jgi:excisionase family DNA binding protein